MKDTGTNIADVTTPVASPFILCRTAGTVMCMPHATAVNLIAVMKSVAHAMTVAMTIEALGMSVAMTTTHVNHNYR